MGMDEKNDAERQALRDAVAAFEPFNEQEAADKRVILRALDTDPDCFDRSAQAHMACSIWVVDPTFTQTLLVYHNIYDSWSWIGGHADGECDLAAVALRELQEPRSVFFVGLADGILIARKIQRDDLLVLHLAPPPFTLFTANAARRSRGTRKKFFLPLFYPMAV